MKSKLVSICVYFFLALLIIFLLRFVVGGDEDNWICDKGVWVKHGNPSAAMPETECKN